MAEDFGAELLVGQINGITEDGAYVDDNIEFGVWGNYQVRSIYLPDPHRYQLGITSPGGFQGQSVAFCQLTASTELWVAEWSAQRFNTAPAIPSPDTGDANWVFLGAYIEPTQMALSPDGVTPLYSINGVYLYGRKNPSDSNIYRDVVFPLPPWMENRFTRTVPTSVLQKGIITLGTGGANEPGSIALGG